MSNIDLRAYAKGLRSQEGFLEIMRLLKAETIRDWANTDAADSAGREARYADIQALGRLESRLQALVDDAAISKRKDEAAALKRGEVRKDDSDTW